MASGKRASMREGPLAALFRKTEEEGLHGEGAPPQQAQEKPEQPREPEAQVTRQREEFRSPTGGVHESPRSPDPEPELRPAPPSARRTRPEPETESERRERRAGRTP